MKTWKTEAKELWLDCGRYLKVERHRVAFDNGVVIDDWPWVITPDYVNVVAVTPDEQFICLRQSKYAIENTTLAPVGGYIEKGDDARGTAERELREETGYASDDWTFLGQFPVDANRGVGTAHFFLARNATFVGHVASDDLEPQEVTLVSREALEREVDQGHITPLPWISAFALALRHC